MRYSIYLTLDFHLNHVASLREHCSRDLGTATSAGAGPRQRDDHALAGVIDPGASDTASPRLCTGLTPAGLALRAWWRRLERRARGWRPAGVVVILGQACFQLPDALAQRLNECRLLRNPFMQPLQLVVRVFQRNSYHWRLFFPVGTAQPRQATGRRGSLRLRARRRDTDDAQAPQGV